VKEKIMQVRTLLRVFALVPGLLGWGALPVCAQASSADIQGQVIDASGSAIAGAKVSLRNTDTGVTSSTIATDGSYSFPAVNPGHYALNVAATGFSAATVSGLTIQLGMHVQQDIRLQIGNTTELVTVTAEAPSVDTTSNAVGSVISNVQINTLPVNTRQYLNLALLMPGTSQDASRTFYNNVQIGGGVSYYANGFRVDGVSNNWAEMGEPRQNFPEGSIQEFKVDITEYPAEYGLSEGGLVTSATKNGTNAFHGEVFEYFRNQNLNVLNSFQEKTKQSEGTGTPPFLRNQFGGDIGGPIIKNRTHFYSAYERTQTDDSYTIYTAEPQYYGTLAGTFDKPSYDQMLTGRVDHQINNAQAIFFRYAQEWNKWSAQGCSGSSEYNCYDGLIPRLSVVGGHTWTLSESMLNDFRFQYARAAYELGPHGSSIPTNPKKISESTLDSLTRGYNFPSFSWGFGYTEVGLEQRYEALDTFTREHGKHSFKAGFDISVIPFTDVTATNYNGTYVFSTDQYFDPNDATSLAALTNATSFTSATPSLSNTEYTRQVGFFAEDFWKVRPNLTVDLGVRWDREFGSFNEQLAGTSLPSKISYMGNPGDRGDRNNFAPRIGFSFDPTGDGQNVLRGGFGIYYGNVQTLQNFSELRDLASCNVSLVSPSYPNPYNGGTASEYCSTAAPTVTVLDSNIQNPYSEQASLGFSHELSKNLTLNVDGLYTHVLRDYRNVDKNYPVDGTRPDSNFKLVNMHIPEGAGKYGALYARLDKRLANHYFYTVSYTSSSSRDNNLQGTLVNYSYPQLDWGPSNIDRRHALVASGGYSLPGGVLAAGMLTLRSSMPFSAYSSSTNSDATTQYVSGTSRNQGNRSLSLATINTYRTTYGLSEISGTDSTAYDSLDLRVSKSFFERGSKSLNIVAQVFNVTGHENLSSITTSAKSSSFGKATSAGNDQQVELAAHFNF
jgi:hypothetical protein